MLQLAIKHLFLYKMHGQCNPMTYKEKLKKYFVTGVPKTMCYP